MPLPGPRRGSDQRGSGGRFLTPLLPRERKTKSIGFGWRLGGGASCWGRSLSLTYSTPGLGG
jgi:hypothetical protein